MNSDASPLDYSDLVDFSENAEFAAARPADNWECSKWSLPGAILRAACSHFGSLSNSTACCCAGIRSQTVVFPGLAEQLDREDQREQLRFRAFVSLCLLGFLLWWPIGVRAWTVQATNLEFASPGVITEIQQ
jgi:hypothetical protein